MTLMITSQVINLLYTSKKDQKILCTLNKVQEYGTTKSPLERLVLFGKFVKNSHNSLQ